jgi:hypothetical protein
MGRRLRVPVILGFGLLAALIAAAAFSSASVSYRSAERDGARVAEVLIGEQAVIVLRTSAGGFTPLERAEIVANRLRSAMAASTEYYDLQAAPLDGGYGVYMNEQLVVAVYQQEANAHGATTEALAILWRDNIVLALGGEIVEEPPAEQPPAEQPPAEAPPAEQPPGEAPPAEAPPTEQPAPAQPVEAPAEVQAAAEPPAVDWTGSAQKTVPVFSAENEGLRLGVAQIAGPTSQVAKVKGVAELRLNFQNVGRVYVYIPVSSISTSLDRVQGVSVWALAGIKVLSF